MRTEINYTITHIIDNKYIRIPDCMDCVLFFQAYTVDNRLTFSKGKWYLNDVELQDVEHFFNDPVFSVCIKFQNGCVAYIEFEDEETDYELIVED